MKLVLIVGAGAVGKMTVGQELMKITNLRLFHNHMMIEPVIDIFGTFKADTIIKLREVIFDDFINSDCEGMIFTLMWAFDMQSDWEYVENLTKKFDEVYCIELIASQSVRLERNKTENQKQKSKYFFHFLIFLYFNFFTYSTNPLWTKSSGSTAYTSLFLCEFKCPSRKTKLALSP